MIYNFFVLYQLGIRPNHSGSSCPEHRCTTYWGYGVSASRWLCAAEAAPSLRLFPLLGGGEAEASCSTLIPVPFRPCFVPSHISWPWQFLQKRVPDQNILPIHRIFPTMPLAFSPRLLLCWYSPSSSVFPPRRLCSWSIGFHPSSSYPSTPVFSADFAFQSLYPSPLRLRQRPGFRAVH